MLTAGSGIDDLDGGSEDDTFELCVNLTSADTVNGGAGTGDEMYVGSSLLDAAFTNVTNVETLELGGGISVVLDVEANGGGGGTTGGGFNRVITSGGADTVTVGDGFTNALAIDISAGGDVTVDAAAKSAGAVTIVADVSDITGSDNLDASQTLAGDTLLLRADNGNAFLNQVSGFDIITVLADTTGLDDAQIYVNANTVVADGKTLTVNASALSSGADFIFDGSAENGLGAVQRHRRRGHQHADGGTDRRRRQRHPHRRRQQ